MQVNRNEFPPLIMNEVQGDSTHLPEKERPAIRVSTHRARARAAARLEMFLKHLDVSFFRVLSGEHVDHLTVLEEDAGRDPTNVVARGSIRILIDVELEDLHFALKLIGQLIDRRAER